MEDIGEDLLESVPELDAAHWPAEGGIPADASPTMDVQGVLADVRAQMERFIEKEIHRVEQAFSDSFQRMEQRLARANAELAAAQAIHERVVKENARQANTIATMRKVLDGP